jgi:site-specific recombinase XerD
MDIENFKAFTKKSGNPDHTIRRYINSIHTYSNFLQTSKGIKNPDKATSNDLKEFVNWGIEELDNVYQDLWGIRMYYQFKNEEEMEMAAIMWMAYTQNETRKLKEFPKVDRDDIEKLSSIGIITVNQLLKACETKKG